MQTPWATKTCQPIRKVDMSMTHHQTFIDLEKKNCRKILAQTDKPTNRSQWPTKTCLTFQFGIAAMDNHMFSDAGVIDEHGTLSMTNSRAGLVKLAQLNWQIRLTDRKFTLHSYLFFQLSVVAMDNHPWSDAHSLGERGAPSLTNSRASLVKLDKFKC